MSDNESFLSLTLSGNAMYDEIDDYIDRWHGNPDGKSLHAYLGMTRDEYGLWLDSPDSLPLIIASRKLNKPLATLANDNLQEMRIAARVDDAAKVRQLQAWLTRRSKS